ncbi:hypothetical protein KSU09_08405 [Fusobacterium nucleatum]|uniref:hypothetical protein n=1 Tax=Fusobacterium nucleatum TaxID=851 RepID=UPI0030D0C5CA
MSVKIKLEKNGCIKNAYTGFSWTLFFFGFWVPLFRLKLKDFFMFLIFFAVKIFAFYLLFKEVYNIGYSIIVLKKMEISYYILTPITLLLVAFNLNIWLAFFYNKYYTTNLLIDGFYTLENDEKSIAILKDYSYLPYSEEELIDSERMERYSVFSKKARKSEKIKVIIFYVLILLYYITIILIALLNNKN